MTPPLASRTVPPPVTAPLTAEHAWVQRLVPGDDAVQAAHRVVVQCELAVGDTSVELVVCLAEGEDLLLILKLLPANGDAVEQRAHLGQGEVVPLEGRIVPDQLG